VKFKKLGFIASLNRTNLELHALKVNINKTKQKLQFACSGVWFLSGSQKLNNWNINYIVQQGLWLNWDLGLTAPRFAPSLALTVPSRGGQYRCTFVPQYCTAVLFYRYFLKIVPFDTFFALLSSLLGTICGMEF